MQPSTSPRWYLDATDVLKSLRGAIVVFLAAAYPVFIDQFQTALGGDFTLEVPKLILALKIAAVSTFVELGRRWMKNHQA